MEPKDPDYTAEERQARSLLKNRDVTGAVSVLGAARQRARVNGHFREASDFSGWIGTLFLSIGRIDDALRELQEAECDEPDNVYPKLTSVEQLLNLTNNGKLALQKLLQIRDRLPALPSTNHYFFDLLGQAYLVLQRRDDALAAFREMADGELVRKVMPQGFCFGLTRRFITEGLALAECARYLDLVEFQATQRNVMEVARTAAELKTRLGNEPQVDNDRR
jgi:tetratricopeptide (TPR) repeat protein